VAADGSLGARNDLRCHSIEHKLGIHGSPTCTMIYGDNGGATGWLVGEENRGMNCMFTMMNNARLAVGCRASRSPSGRRSRRSPMPASASRGGRRARAVPAPLSRTPDVKRMLMTMRALTVHARTLCYATAAAIDRSHRDKDDAARKAAH